MLFKKKRKYIRPSVLGLYLNMTKYRYKVKDFLKLFDTKNSYCVKIGIKIIIKSKSNENKSFTCGVFVTLPELRTSRNALFQNN